MILSTALLRRARDEVSAVRRQVAGMNRWRLLRWLVLPLLFLWGAAPDVLARPWHAAPVLVATAALLARYRWPATALLAVATMSVVPAVVVALPFLAYGAGRRPASGRRAGATFVAAGIVAGAGALVWLDGTLTWPTRVALMAGYVTTVVLLPGAVGAIAGERVRRVEYLRERNAILERAQRLGDLRARMQERARIAGEMHDLLGHRLSLIALYAGALELRTREHQPELNTQADLIRSTAGTALDELREVLGLLRVDAGRPDGEGPADSVGKRADIESLVDSSRAAGQPVILSWEGGDLTDVDVRVRRAVHRVVRESLTNVHKHAPGAPARMTVRLDAVRASVEVRNALRSPQTSPSSTGLGLVGLQERARLVGGTVAARREADEFVLTASLPLAVAGTRAVGGSDHADPHIDRELLDDGQTPGGVPVPDAGRTTETSPTRSIDTMSKPAKIILAVLISVVVLACGGGAIAVYVFATKADKASITSAQYDAVRSGQTREEVQRTIGDVGSLGKMAVDQDREPPVPSGARCDYAISRDGKDDVPTYVYRFCYVGDKLVEKKKLTPAQSSTP